MLATYLQRFCMSDRRQGLVVSSYSYLLVSSHFLSTHPNLILPENHIVICSRIAVLGIVKRSLPIHLQSKVKIRLIAVHLNLRCHEAIICGARQVHSCFTICYICYNFSLDAGSQFMLQKKT